MSILIRIQNTKLFLEGDLDEDVRDEIQKTLSYTVPNFRFTKKYKQQQEAAKHGMNDTPWDGNITIVRSIGRRSGLYAPTGMLSYIREILANNDVEYNIREERNPLIRTPGYTAPSLILRPYQEEAVSMALKRGRGVMKAATGSGKTEMIVSSVVRASSFPAIFYVNSCDLLEQAYDRFSKYVLYNGVPAKIGRIGGGHCDVRPITIATVQSCQRVLTGKFSKYGEDDYSPDDKTKFNNSQKSEIRALINDAQFVFVDECQHTSCETIQEILNASNGARIRIGGSASPWRDDGLDILIEACFGKKICDISASFLINEGYLLKPHITFHHFNDVFPASDWMSIYRAYVVNNDKRNQWIADRAKMHMSNDRSTIILVKWSTHAELIKELLPEVEVLTSTGKYKKKAKDRKKVLDAMRTGEVMGVIGTTLLDEGIDVPSAEAGIFAGGGKSSTRELQRVGRFIRKNPNKPQKTMAWIDEIHDHANMLTWQAKKRRDILKTEEAFEISDRRVS